jgi:hypothetical protein
MCISTPAQVFHFPKIFYPLVHNMLIIKVFFSASNSFGLCSIGACWWFMIKDLHTKMSRRLRCCSQTWFSYHSFRYRNIM